MILDNDLITRESFDDSIIKNINSKKGIFKPDFCATMQWSELKTNAVKITYDSDTVKKLIDSTFNQGIDNIILTFRSGIYNNEYTIADDFDKYDEYIKYAMDKGIKIHALKLHIASSIYDIKSIIGYDVFKEKYTEIITSIGSHFKKYGCKIFTVFNEYPMIYCEDSWSGFTKECLDLSRTLGYKTGITHSNYELQTYTSTTKTKGIEDGSSDIWQHVDYLLFNMYPQVSREGEMIEAEDVINSFKNAKMLYPYFRIKKNNPNLKLIISEIGVQDYYIALSYPAYYRWGSDAIPQGGYVQSLYLTGIFETLNKSFIESVWWYYDLNNIGYSDKVIKHYVRGEK